jgi:hypothetical protein
MTEPKVKLAGKCIIHADIGHGSSKIEIPRVSKKTGKNNADDFINQAFHFAIMRHGKEKVIEMLNKKCELYGDEYKTQGIQ